MNYKVPVPVHDEDGIEVFKDRLLYIADGLMDEIEMEGTFCSTTPTRSSRY